MSALKEQKEAFVTGHTGTNPFEVLLICSAVPVGVTAFRLLSKTAIDRHRINSDFLTFLKVLLLEALVLLFPITVNQTNFLYPWGVLWMVALALVGVAVLVASEMSSDKQARATASTAGGTSSNLERLDFISYYRSSVLFLTFVAILAVDFHLFPRKLAKTEAAGFGLMDLGAGSYVVAAGLVSRRAKAAGEGRSKPLSVMFWIKHVLPLLVLGFIRLATTKGLEYQEHVSEYGVHWNFFFTLAGMAPFAQLMPLGWVVPTVTMVVYQILLSRNGLQSYIEKAPRTCDDNREVWFPMAICDLFAANREGFLGCIGYLALYLWSEYIGHVCIWKDHQRQTNRGRLLYVAAILLWVTLAVSVGVLQIPVSRRSTNLPFVVWTLAHNMILLALLYSACRPVPAHSDDYVGLVSPVMSAINRNGLLVFVVANLLTGAVNLSIDTMAVSDPVALGVLLLYLSAVSIFALLMNMVLHMVWPSKVKPA